MLAKAVKQHDANRGRQIEAASVRAHRDLVEILRELLADLFGNTCRLRAKDHPRILVRSIPNKVWSRDW